MIDSTVHHSLHKIEAELRQKAARDLYQKTQGFHVPRARAPQVHISLAWVSLAGRALSAPFNIVGRSVLGRSTYDIRTWR